MKWNKIQKNSNKLKYKNFINNIKTSLKISLKNLKGIIINNQIKQKKKSFQKKI